MHALLHVPSNDRDGGSERLCSGSEGARESHNLLFSSATSMSFGSPDVWILGIAHANGVTREQSLSYQSEHTQATR